MLVARPRPTISKDALYCKTKIASDMSVSIFPKWLDAMERMIQMGGGMRALEAPWTAHYFHPSCEGLEKDAE